jgi:hypothetical protein
MADMIFNKYIVWKYALTDTIYGEKKIPLGPMLQNQ